MINEQDKQRIEKAAIKYYLEHHGDPQVMYSGYFDMATAAYIAGATAELERSEKLLKEYREVIKELLPYAEMTEKWQSNYLIAEEIRSKVNRAKSLIETTSKQEKQ